MVSIFTCVDSSELDVFDYSSADVNWLHCMVGHRRNRYFLDVIKRIMDYDVISGKTANDNTNATITAYFDGLYGEIGSDRADRMPQPMLAKRGRSNDDRRYDTGYCGTGKYL